MDEWMDGRTEDGGQDKMGQDGAGTETGKVWRNRARTWCGRTNREAGDWLRGKSGIARREGEREANIQTGKRNESEMRGSKWFGRSVHH